MRMLTGLPAKSGHGKGTAFLLLKKELRAQTASGLEAVFAKKTEKARQGGDRPVTGKPLMQVKLSGNAGNLIANNSRLL